MRPQSSTNRNKKHISYFPEEKNKNNDKSRFNVFMIIGLNKNYYNKDIISFYYANELSLIIQFLM